MSLDKVGSENGGYMVIALPSGQKGTSSVEGWSFRHFQTESEATEAAKGFAAQAAGYQAFVVPVTGYHYRPLGT